MSFQIYSFRYSVVRGFPLKCIVCCEGEVSQVIKIVSEKSLKKEFTPFQITGLTIYSMKVLIYTKVVL